MARLEDTDFARAIVGYNVFALTSLKTARGLDACVHRFPNSIDYQTLRASGPLPEVFLRGCGLPDDYIKFLPSFCNQPFEFYSCFISYSHADKSFARRLHDALQGRGIRCWLDEHQLVPGEHIHRAVDEGIRLWDKVMLCCSEASLRSWWVDNEMQKALMKEEQLSKERGKTVFGIIPLNLDGYIFGEEWKNDWKWQHVNSRMAADFTGWEKDNGKFEEQVERVVKALRADGMVKLPPPKAKL